MDFKAYTLKKVATWIVGYELFEKVAELVTGYLTDDTKTGAEKREAVKADLKEIRVDFVGFLVNLAIEVAVVLTRRAAGTK